MDTDTHVYRWLAGVEGASMLARFHCIMLGRDEFKEQRPLWGFRVRPTDWFQDNQASDKTIGWLMDWAQSLSRDSIERKYIASNARYLPKAFRVLTDLLPCSAYRTYPHVVIHGDYCPANIGLESGHVKLIYDFDDCSLDLRIFDLATIISHFAGKYGIDLEQKRARPLIDAYREVMEMDSGEIALAPLMMIARNFYYIMCVLGTMEKCPDISGMMPLQLFFEALKWQIDNFDRLSSFFKQV